MNRLFKVVILVISMLFLAVFAWKNAEVSSEDATGSEIAKKDISDEQQFWRHMNKGDEFRLKGDYENAKVSYSKALEFKESHAGALYYLGNVQLFTKDYQNAEKNWQQIVKDDPIVARAWLQLGKIYFCRDSGNPFYNPAEAKGYFEKAAALNRENTGPPLHLAKIAILNKDYTGAEEYLEGIIAQNFKSYEGMFLKGFVDWKRGREKSAFKELNETVEIFINSNQIKMDGEGATKTGSNPMLSEEITCDFIGREIRNVLKNSNGSSTMNIYQEFDVLVEEWSTEI